MYTICNTPPAQNQTQKYSIEIVLNAMEGVETYVPYRGDERYQSMYVRFRMIYARAGVPSTGDGAAGGGTFDHEKLAIYSGGTEA